jgi:cysteine desulfurase / selenocysteine lyase
MIDLEQARHETPGCQHVTHLNNAGASLMPDPVLRAVTDHLELEARDRPL